MKTIHALSTLTLACAAGLAPLAHAADPVPPQIQNLVCAQRSGSFFVDITYDLVDPDSQKLYLFVECSSDGGSTYSVPIRSTTGDLGAVTPGLGKKIVWNVWNDWAGNHTANARIRLVADDTASAIPPPPTTPPTANLIWIPSGTFKMGLGDPMVWLTKSFWMGKYEVTQSEYEKVMTNNPSYFKGPNLPVESLRWAQAVEYCQRLTELERTAGRVPEGWGYRLPTEAEWEYACRAGTTTEYYFGNDRNRIGAYAWYHVNSQGRTHPGGLKAPNRWGLYDMIGNVEEWCSDWFGNLPSGGVTDPAGPSHGSGRVYRGGHYVSSSATGSGARQGAGYDEDWRASQVGFRVVLAPNQ